MKFFLPKDVVDDLAFKIKAKYTRLVFTQADYGQDKMSNAIHEVLNDYDFSKVVFLEEEQVYHDDSE